jgi:O-antigen/teichoic acid export membrane protein
MSDAALRYRQLSALTPEAVWRMASGRGGRVLAVRCLGIAALFGFEVALARSLGVSGYGAFSFGLALAGLASRLGPLGWLNISTRLVSSYVSLGKDGLLKGSLIVAHAATAVGLAAALPLLIVASSGADPSPGGVVLPYVVAVAVALAFLELHRHVLRGLHAGDLGEALVILLLPLVSAGVVWTFGIRDVRTAGYVYAATSCGLLLASSIAITRRLPAPIWKSKAQFEIRAWSLAALAILLGSAASEVITRISVVLLGVLGSDQDVALYHAAARLALMNVFVLRALTPVAAPHFSELYSAGRLAELRTLFRRQCLLSFAGAVPVFIVLTAFPGPVLALFGPAFIASETTLRVLSIGYLASATTGPCGTALMMIGRERAYAGITFIALLAGVAANYILIQQMGALGAAVATAAVLVFNNALYLAVFLRATRPQAVASAS